MWQTKEATDAFKHGINKREEFKMNACHFTGDLHRCMHLPSLHVNAGRNALWRQAPSNVRTGTEREEGAVPVRINALCLKVRRGADSHTLAWQRMHVMNTRAREQHSGRTGREHEEGAAPIRSEARLPQPPEGPPRRRRPVSSLVPINERPFFARSNLRSDSHAGCACTRYCHSEGMNKSSRVSLHAHSALPQQIRLRLVKAPALLR